jgi:hypothetical protein
LGVPAQPVSSRMLTSEREMLNLVLVMVLGSVPATLPWPTAGCEERRPPAWVICLFDCLGTVQK